MNNEKFMLRTYSECEMSWNELKTIAQTLCSGDFITLTLKNGDKVDLDVGHDETGNTYLIFHNSMTNQYAMSDYCTSVGGWKASKMRTYVNKDVFSLLPDGLQAIIEPTTIIQVIDGKRMETQDKLFCLSLTQVFGKKECWKDREPDDTQIDIFKDPCNRQKADTSWWWLRTGYNDFYFNGVNTRGDYSFSVADSLGSVVLGFRI